MSFDIKNICADEFRPVDIDVDFSKQAIELNYFCTIESIVQLDSNQIVGEISKLLVHNNNLFIMDKTSKSFFCFDTLGKLKWKYDKVGAGPEDLMQFSDFHFRNNNIFLFSNTGGKIVQLDSNGHFLNYFFAGKPKIGFYPDYLFLNDQGKLILCNSDMGDFKDFPFLMTVQDTSTLEFKSFHIQKSSKPSVKRWLSESFPMKPFSDNTGFYYTEVLNDTIYSFEKGGFHRKYVLNFGKKTIPPSIKKEQSLTLDRFYKLPYAGNIQGVFDTDSLLTFVYLLQGTPTFIFLNKFTNKIKQFRTLLFNGGPLIKQVQFIGSDKENFIFGIEPFELINAYKNFKKNYKNLRWEEYDNLLRKEYPGFIKMSKVLTINSNMVIVFIKISGAKLFENGKK